VLNVGKAICSHSKAQSEGRSCAVPVLKLDRATTRRCPLPPRQGWEARTTPSVRPPSQRPPPPAPMCPITSARCRAYRRTRTSPVPFPHPHQRAPTCVIRFQNTYLPVISTWGQGVYPSPQPFPSPPIFPFSAVIHNTLLHVSMYSVRHCAPLARGPDVREFRGPSPLSCPQGSTFWRCRSRQTKWTGLPTTYASWWSIIKLCAPTVSRARWSKKLSISENTPPLTRL
jgi:hypothetical protein